MRSMEGNETNQGERATKWMAWEQTKVKSNLKDSVERERGSRYLFDVVAQERERERESPRSIAIYSRHLQCTEGQQEETMLYTQLYWLN